MGVLKEVLCLWAPNRRTDSSGLVPSTVDKGATELAERGWVVRGFYPKEVGGVASFLRRLTRGRASMITSIPALVSVARAIPVIYTSEVKWAFYCGLLKRFGLINNRIVVYWAGFDVPPALSFLQILYYGIAIERADHIRFVSETDCQFWAVQFPKHAHRFVVYPTAVDVRFYDPVRVSVHQRRNPRSVVCVGNDAMRDWGVPSKLADDGFHVTFLSKTAAAKRAAEGNTSGNLTIVPDADFFRSAEIMANCGCILLATQPNIRFSGATSVGVAAALGVPLVLDEHDDLNLYRLSPGTNCEYFRRGDVDGAKAAVTKILAERDRYSAEISLLRDYLNIERWVDLLERLLDEQTDAQVRENT